MQKTFANNMDAETKKRADNVVENKDAKSIFVGYNTHKSMAAYYRDSTHHYLMAPHWTPKALEQQIAWHEYIANKLVTKLIALDYNVLDKNFWNNQHIFPIAGLIIKKCSASKEFVLVSSIYDMEKDMYNSLDILEYVNTPAQAHALYAALCDVDWSKNNISWSCSWQYAGWLVDDLRSGGEDCLDFYCTGHEGVVDPLVEELLGKLGWTPTLKIDE